MRLEEKHKRCVELWIRCTPRDEIASELGVARSTVFLWMKDPLVLSYHQKLLEELEAARRQRLLPAFLNTVELFEAGVQRALFQLQSDDPAEQVKAPSLQTLASVLKTVHALERTDVGAPSSISKSIGEEELGKPRKRTTLERLLDQVAAESDLPTLEMTPASLEEGKDE